MNLLDIIKVNIIVKMISENLDSSVSMIYDKDTKEVIISDASVDDIYRFQESYEYYTHVRWTPKLIAYYTKNIFCVIPIKLQFRDVLKIRNVLKDCKLKKK